MHRNIRLFLLAILIAGAAQAERAVDETRPAAADARISIDTVAGKLEITAWERNELKVTGSLGDDVEALEIRGGPADLTVRVKVPRGDSRRRRDIKAELRVQVPRGCRLEVDSVSSAVAASGLGGTVEIDSVSGAVTVAGDQSLAEVATVSGAIRIAGSSGTVSAESVSGRIELEGVAGRLEVASVSGSIAVAAGTVAWTELESLSGSIRFQGRLGAGARLTAEAHSGNVELILPADTSARFKVTTFSGDIENQFGPPAERSSRYGPGKSLEFTAGGGDAEVSVEVFSGNVALRKS